MIVQMVIKNNYGVFKSEKLNLDEDQYSKLVEASKGFYNAGGFEMTTENGFVVLPPEVVQKSILILEILKSTEINSDMNT